MFSLSAKIRKELGKKVKNLRKNNILPGILYGPKIEKSLPIEINLKEFEKIYKKAGETSLITLAIATREKEDLSSLPSLETEKEKFLVLINEIKTEPLSGKIIHVDFYQPRLDKEIEADIPLIFEGEAPACKELGGTLVKNIHEVKVKALPKNLPHEIKVNVEKLKTLENIILIKDLIIQKEVKILKDPEEVVVLITPPEKVEEEELKKPIEEKVEEVEKVEKKKKEEEEIPIKESN
jgi:large subunit ribosomal protein L25